jgi:hypothetical protein
MLCECALKLFLLGFPTKMYSIIHYREVTVDLALLILNTAATRAWSTHVHALEDDYHHLFPLVKTDYEDGAKKKQW